MVAGHVTCGCMLVAAMHRAGGSGGAADEQQCMLRVQQQLSSCVAHPNVGLVNASVLTIQRLLFITPCRNSLDFPALPWAQQQQPGYVPARGRCGRSSSQPVWAAGRAGQGRQAQLRVRQAGAGLERRHRHAGAPQAGAWWRVTAADAAWQQPHLRLAQMRCQSSNQYFSQYFQHVL